MKPSGTGSLVMFENRLSKLKKERTKWAKRNSIECYRVYSEDIPQVPVILDSYPTGFVLYDKSSLRHQDEEEQKLRFEKIANIVCQVMECPSDNLHLKQRKKQKGVGQYEKLNSSQNFSIVQEGGFKFFVNLTDFLDTGLFLDHRWTRQKIQEIVRGKSFLNLFSYTGSFTVYAAKGGATKTKSIDLSKTYCNWMEENLKLNGISTESNQILQRDVLDWLDEESKNRNRETYDLIFIDPPTFSNSKRMLDVWDIQSKHRNLLLLLGTKFLNPGGEVWFSTNFRKFKMEISQEEWSSYGFVHEDWTKRSIPEDFRDPKVHTLYRFYQSQS